MRLLSFVKVLYLQICKSFVMVDVSNAKGYVALQ